MQRKYFASVIGLFAVASALLIGLSKPSFADVQEPPEAPIPQAAPADSVETLLEAVGTMGGVQLYQTYLNIGFIADGKGQNVYTAEEAEELLMSIVAPLDHVTKQFQSVKQIATDDDDKKALDRLSKIAGMLKGQAKSLESLWANGSKGEADRFEKDRQDAWREISDFLHLNADAEQAEPAVPELAPAPKKVR